MNNIRDEVAIFRISTVKTAQTITFGALPGVLAGGTVTATATASSGLTVSFSVASSSICTLSGSAGPSVTVTAVAAGTCEVRANQAGDDSYNAATQVPRSFTVTAQAPSAPQNVTLVPGPGRMSVQFDAPASNGGLPITGYTATCSASGQTTRSTTGTNSPLVVTDLKAGVTYSCSVTASNGSFTSPASATKTDKPRSTDLTPILMLLSAMKLSFIPCSLRVDSYQIVSDAASPCPARPDARLSCASRSGVPTSVQAPRYNSADTWPSSMAARSNGASAAFSPFGLPGTILHQGGSNNWRRYRPMVE